MWSFNPLPCRENAVPINLHRARVPTSKKENVFVFRLHAHLMIWRLNFGPESSVDRFQKNLKRSFSGAILKISYCIHLTIIQMVMFFINYKIIIK